MTVFLDVRPLLSGAVGHPANELGSRKMFKCAGVTITCPRTRDIWTFRIYAPAKGWPETAVWTQAKFRGVSRGGKSTGHWPLVVLSEEHVPQDIVAFIKAELVRLRLLGKIQA